jgi:hypothetical protein
MALVRADQEAAWNGLDGTCHLNSQNLFSSTLSIWNPDYVALLKAAKVAVFRDLNWVSGNTTQVTTWATRKPVNYFSYLSNWYANTDQAGNQVWAGSTSGSGDTFTIPQVSVGPSCPTDKQTLIVKWDHSGVSTPTLNYNSCGAVPIVGPDGQDVFGILPYQGRLDGLVYDAQLNTWMQSNTSGGSTGSDAGIVVGTPPEVLLDICERIGAHPWFTSGAYDLDPMTNYTKQLATYMKANAPAWMVPRYEVYPNESWNNNPFTAYERYKAIANWGGGSAGTGDETGKMASTVGQDLASVYGTVGTGYVATAGVQNAGCCTNWNITLNSTQYLAQAGAPQSGYTKTAAYNYLTHLNTATYTEPSEQYTAQEIADTYTYATGSGPTQVATANAYAATAQNSASNCQDFQQYQNSIPCVTGYYEAGWVSYAAGFTNNAGNTLKVMEYEGGYQFSYGVAQRANLQISSITPGSSTVVNISANQNVNTIFPSGILWLIPSGISGTLGAALNGNIYFFLSQTSSSVTIPVNTTGLTGSGGTILGLNLLNSAVDPSLGITGFTHTTNAQITLSSDGFFNTSVLTGFAGAVAISGVAESSACYNGLSGTVTGVASNVITTNINASACGSFPGGGLVTFTGQGANGVAMRIASMQASNQVTNNHLRMTDAAAQGVQFPSQFEIAGTCNAPTSCDQWAPITPSLYGGSIDGSPIPIWTGFSNYSNGL